MASQSSPQVPRGELSGRLATRRRQTRPEHRNFGTIIDTRGRFKVRYTGPDRKLHRAGMTFTTRERAQGWLAGELKLIEFGEWTPPAERRRQAEAASITFDEFAREWIDHRLAKGRPLKDRTREHYLDIHERWFTPFHDRPLAAITHADVDRWYRNLPDAPTMRSHAYSLLKSIYRTAASRRLITESPVAVEGATARTTPKDITLLTVAQVQALADAMPPRHRLLVLLAAWCGLRFGELTALRRGDLDLDEGTITVEQAAVTVGGQRVITTPKSAAGRRTVYLPPHLIEDVRAHLAVFTDPDADALVFPGNDEQPLTPRGTQPVAVHHAPIAWHRFDVDTYTIGRPDHVLPGGLSIGLYSAQRTLIGLFRLRHIWGSDLALDALKRWLRARGNSPGALMALAQSFPKARPAIQHALEVLL